MAFVQSVYRIMVGVLGSGNFEIRWFGAHFSNIRGMKHGKLFENVSIRWVCKLPLITTLDCRDAFLRKFGFIELRHWGLLFALCWLLFEILLLLFGTFCACFFLPFAGFSSKSSCSSFGSSGTLFFLPFAGFSCKSSCSSSLVASCARFFLPFAGFFSKSSCSSSSGTSCAGFF